MKSSSQNNLEIYQQYTTMSIGNITGNETKTAIYYDKVEGIYGPLKAHGLANWSFKKEGQVADEKAKKLRMV
ncbi:hypothetical protein QN324_01210 [Streptococcus agalactiae]|uniref:hypothetical protein n=1 Tax=Streptococcus agalactiae TaxID=1311 RepID=UPI003F15E6CC